MKKIRVIFAALFLLFALLALPANASFPGDRGALVTDSAYFKDRGFDSASQMLSFAENKKGETFVLVFYSRYDQRSAELIPQIRSWADANACPVYGIDQYNKYTQEYGYFSKNTAFVGWEKYIDRRKLSFPAIFIYNADTRIFKAENGIDSMTRFTSLLAANGILKTAYHDYIAADACAKQLAKLGLFRGTQNGDDLTRAPTRAEALTMLIRLLGREEDALALAWKHPFTDVPGWAEPYVGYAYGMGITTGISDTLFGADDSVTSAQFLTFVLRALAYESGEGRDFRWDAPFALAQKCGILQDGVNTREFLRAEMVSVSRAALDATVKSSKNTLLEKLVKNRAVSASDVKTVLNIDVAVPSVTDEYQTGVWQDTLRIKAESLSYTVSAVNTAVRQRPDTVAVTVPVGREAEYSEYILSKIEIPAEAVTKIDVLLTEGCIYYAPEYTVAAGARAYLKLKNYNAGATERNTAAAAQTLVNQWGGVFSDETVYLWAVGVFSPESRNTDADGALLALNATADGVNRAVWLLYELAE